MPGTGITPCARSLPSSVFCGSPPCHLRPTGAVLGRERSACFWRCIASVQGIIVSIRTSGLCDISPNTCSERTGERAEKRRKTSRHPARPVPSAAPPRRRAPGSVATWWLSHAFKSLAGAAAVTGMGQRTWHRLGVWGREAELETSATPSRGLSHYSTWLDRQAPPCVCRSISHGRARPATLPCYSARACSRKPPREPPGVELRRGSHDLVAVVDRVA
jgi:hypothetical protein